MRYIELRYTACVTFQDFMKVITVCYSPALSRLFPALFMAFILGKKVGMTQIFREDGIVVPVTVIEAGPITVTQLKSPDKEGYGAVQFGYGVAKHPNKPATGHTKNAGSNPKTLRELHGDDKAMEAKEFAVGETLTVSIFKPGDIVKISGNTKARGFQGAVKRHGFHGMPASHGHHHVMRHVGSIGQRFPQHTLPGMRMAGRMGGKRQSTRGLEVISVDADHNTMTVRGAVPGRRGTLLEIRTQ